ncbi:FixH family protein [Agaribacter flavus]|uniref:FixH family protein n=1 Tax=Agaribacter flavus TaxID=1902781 RepID=A0ABV7FN38_9ALTE
MQQTDVTPWYKQFWPWFLIAIPLSSIIVGSIVLRFATDGTNTLVVDDYYKEGKSINARLDKIEKAQALAISTELSFENSSVVVTFLSGQPDDGTALKLNFYHVTQAHRDVELLLTRDAQGNYRASVDFNIEGKWRIRLMPIDESWKLQKKLRLPQASPIKMIP